MAESTQGIILNVDDNEALRYTKTRVVRAAGFTVYEAGSGQEALRRLREVHPHLVLLDVRLPDMDGVEIARAIKADPALANVLVLQTSATFVEGGDRVRALEGGADSYLVEPVEPEELIANIKALLRLRRAEDKVRESERLLRLATTAAKLDTWSVTLSEEQELSVSQFAQRTTLPLDLTDGGEPHSARIHREDHARLESALRAALAGQADYDVEYRMITSRGEVHWIASQATVLRDARGKPRQVIGVAQDVTDRKLADIERERLLKREQIARMEAEEATRLKDEFLATVSHELRTPLNAITGWVHLLRSGKLSPIDMQRGLETIHRNAESQSRLINDLLDVSRIISGKLRLDVQPLALLGLVESAIDTVRPAAEAKGVRLQAVLDPAAGPVAGDPERLQQVIWNLLTNAVKFSNKGGQVQIRLQKIDSHAELSVSDSGAGIAPDFLPYVFHPFQQAEGATTRKHPGLGLGLAIVRHLVELHGGRASAASAGEGKGATFTVILPIVVTTNSASGETDSNTVASGRDLAAVPTLSGVRVLLVDDEADAREVLSTMLQQAGAIVLSVPNAADALALLDREAFDVLVSDIGMPGEDGYALIRSVRQRAIDSGGRIPAAALTAYARTEDRLRALAAGFQIHVPKPVQPEELVTVVASLAGRIG
jgi:signal transduction histidine kinase